MASVFWDAETILFIDYLEKGKTITGEYYSNLLTRLDGGKKSLVHEGSEAAVHRGLYFLR